jgi:hypothetical protein
MEPVIKGILDDKHKEYTQHRIPDRIGIKVSINSCMPLLPQDDHPHPENCKNGSTNRRTEDLLSYLFASQF